MNIISEMPVHDDIVILELSDVIEAEKYNKVIIDGEKYNPFIVTGTNKAIAVKSNKSLNGKNISFIYE